MTAADVEWFLQVVDRLGITVWLDGGWGVDALLGEQTRRHADLDIIVQGKEAPALRDALAAAGFRDVYTDDRSEWNFVMAHDDGRRIDFHVIVVDEEGRGIYGPPSRGISYPADALTAMGTVGARPVRCLTPEYQVESHMGYVFGDDDLDDMIALSRRFGVALPEQHTQAIVRRGYEEVAERYLARRDRTKSLIHLDRMLDLLHPRARILDLGCGAGVPVDSYLVRKGHQVVGLDVSSRQIEMARSNVPRASFQVRDLLDIEEGEFAVDAVVSFYTIFHTPRETHADTLRKVGTFLAPGGLLLVTMGSSDWEGVEDFHGAPMWWSHYGPERNRELIGEAGFQVLSDDIDRSGGERHQVILARKR